MDNIKMKKIICENGNWIEMPLDRVQCREDSDETKIP
jgi:hypothetical protein